MDYHAGSNKLSLLAAFDDVVRVQQSIYESSNESFLAPIKLAKDYEALRQKYFSVLQEISLKNIENEQLRGKLHLSNTHLDTVRRAYSREISKNDALMKDYKILAKKVAAVQDVLNDESNGRYHPLESHKSVMSILSDLKDIPELSLHNDSHQFDDDGLNFDKTEDSINASIDRHISVICNKNNNKNNENGDNAKNRASRRPRPEEISPTNSNSSSVDSGNQPSTGTEDNSSSNSDDRGSENCGEQAAKTPSNMNSKYVTSSPSLYSSAVVPETIENRRRLLRSASCKKIKLDLTRLDSRPHGQLQPKKVFKPNIICAPCGKAIGFCGKALACPDCRSVCHPSCASQLTLPCIPHYTPKAVKCTGGGGLRKIVVSDFIDRSVRPFVPAILVYLCTEIERRGLSEEGLYRKCGSDREIRELKQKFLTSKTGPPNTRQLDIHVLCGVVKNFLRELDDPLITRILWHDFVRASDLTVHSQEKSNELLKRSIDLLPEPNRDTLAYIILHLHKVTDACVETKMTITSLSKIFGPTIVGSSSSGNSSSSSGVIAENVKQNLTMQALLSLPTGYWEELLHGSDIFKTPAGQMSTSFRVSAATTGGKSSMANFQSPLSYLSASSSIYATPAAVGRVARYAPVKPVNLFGTDPIY